MEVYLWKSGIALFCFCSEAKERSSREKVVISAKKSISRQKTDLRLSFRNLLLPSHPWLFVSSTRLLHQLSCAVCYVSSDESVNKHHQLRND
jgi:hypothetical protein